MIYKKFFKHFFQKHPSYNLFSFSKIILTREMSSYYIYSLNHNSIVRNISKCLSIFKFCRYKDISKQLKFFFLTIHLSRFYKLYYLAIFTFKSYKTIYILLICKIKINNFIDFWLKHFFSKSTFWNLNNEILT